MHKAVEDRKPTRNLRLLPCFTQGVHDLISFRLLVLNQVLKGLRRSSQVLRPIADKGVEQPVLSSDPHLIAEGVLLPVHADELD